MTFVWICIGVFIAGAIVFLLMGSHPKAMSREKFLEELAKHVNGECRPVPDVPNAFQIAFRYEDEEFVFEDRESMGFSETLFKGYLKARTLTHFTVQFVEKEKTATVKSELVIASKIGPELARAPHVSLPAGFDDYSVFANQIEAASKLFADRKVAAIFRQYQNRDPRGSRSSSLKVVDGEVQLEFHPDGGSKPNMENLRMDVTKIDDYLDQVLAVKKAVNKIAL